MNQKANAKREFPYVTLILIVTLVLVVAIVGYSLVDTLGVVSHFNTAAKSDNIKINENIVDVYRYITATDSVLSNAQNFYMYYLYYGSSASSMVGSALREPFNIFCTYISAGYDYISAAYATVEICVREGHFDLAAYTYARNILTYCEGAMADKNYTEDTEGIERDVDTYIKNLKEMAERDMGTTLSSYLTRYMGNGVSKSDLKKALTYQYRARDYASMLNEKYIEEARGDKAAIDKYVEENKSLFYTSEYYSFNLLDKDMMEAVSKCKTIDEVKTTIADIYMKKNYDTQYKKYITDAKITDSDADKTKEDIRTTILALAKVGDNKAVFKASDKDYKKACYDIAKAIYDTTKLSTFMTGTATSTAYADPTGKNATDLQKWLFDPARKTGDITALKIESKNSSTGATTTSYVFYKADKLMILDEELTRDAYYVKLTDDGENVKDGLTAAEKADKMYAALKDIKDEDDFADKFAELVSEYAPSSSTATYGEQTLLKYDTLKNTSKDLADWIFNPLRKEGDLAILPLSEADKKVEDEAAEAEKETETEATTEAETNDSSDTTDETEATTEKETDAETSKPSDDKKDTSRYLVYFTEKNDKTWIENALMGIAGEKLDAWFEENVVKFHVEVDGEYDTSAYTETETETEAATKAEDKKDETTATTESAAA